MRLAAVVSALVAALAFAAAAPSASAARLRVVAKHPLTVVGSGFQVKRCAAYIIAARGSLASFAIVRARNACASP